MERYQYCFDNAKNDPKAPIHFFGLFKGYLAFDTGQPFHYSVWYQWMYMIYYMINVIIYHYFVFCEMLISCQYLFQWLSIITCAVLYNVVFVIGRAVFWEMENLLPAGWFVLDYTCDLLYIIDMFIRMHEGMITFIDVLKME